MSSEVNLLGQCSAIIVGHDGECASLMSLARKVGFGAFHELNDAPDPKRPEFRVTYFLVNQELSDQSKVTLIRRLRGSPAMKVRFAPIIAIGEDVDFEVILHHVRLGFDDFISLPESGAIVKNRLISQLGQLHTYVETATYFGPDRRRMELPGKGSNQRKSAPHSHTRMVVRRSTDRGIEIVSQQIFL